MATGSPQSFEELQGVRRFESLRRLLLSSAYANHLERPLAYWALPTDRRLPLAFLGRSLRDLLETPFADLAATPGVGRKKMASFMQLLARAANTDPSRLPADSLDLVRLAASDCPETPASSERFDPVGVSEAMWAQWRANVVRHGLTGEKLGRLAPSLRSMTRVIWNTPLGAYAGSTLADIRAMRTHGEKRVAAILETVHAANAIVAGMGAQGHLVVRIVPRRIDRVEQWTGQMLQRFGVPGQEEIFENFIEPLLDQVRVDAPRQIVALAESRLGINGPMTSVRQAARLMGLTRARVYQLLNEINDILSIRWPLGRHQSHELAEKLLTESAETDGDVDLRQFFAAVELFYPGSRRGAAGPLESTAAVPEPDETKTEDSQLLLVGQV